MDWMNILIAVVGGGVLAKGFDAVTNFKNNNSDRASREKKEKQDEWKLLFDRQGEELCSAMDRVEKVEARVTIAEKKLNDCEKEHIRAMTRLQYYEEIMTKEGVKFKPWSPVPGEDTGTYSVVAPTPPKQGDLK